MEKVAEWKSSFLTPMLTKPYDRSLTNICRASNTRESWKLGMTVELLRVKSGLPLSMKI